MLIVFGFALCLFVSSCFNWFTIHDVWDGLVLLLCCALAQDFVNGMVCQVMSFDSKSGCLQVQTATGKRLAVPSIREKVNGNNVDHFPVRVGYASTVPKVQGQTLKHLTFWPDVAGCPAAGYVALSRVRRDEDYLIGGRVHPSHFRPAM